MASSDLDLLARVIGPVLGAVVGWLLARVSERRSKLVTYYGHVGAFQIQPPPAQAQGGGQQQQPPQLPPPFSVHAHTVVIRNAGRKAASNVRVSHDYLPMNLSVFPRVPYNVDVLPGGGADIVLPQLVPGEQVTINYLYFPPVTYDQITRGVRSDDGFAKVVTALPTPQPARLLSLVSAALLILGAIVALFLLAKVIIALAVHYLA